MPQSTKQPIDKPARKKRTAKDPSKAPKHTDVNKIKRRLRKNPLTTQQQLADEFGVSKSAINRLLKRHGINTTNLQDYKDMQADIFDGKADIVLHHINEAAIKRMVEKAPMAAVTLLNSCFNNSRLARGLSTSNTAMVYASAVVDAHKSSPKPVDNSKAPQDVVLDAEEVTVL